MKAAEFGSMDICVALLKAGSDPFVVDTHGRNAEFYAKTSHPDRQIHVMLKAYMDSISNATQDVEMQV